MKLTKKLIAIALTGVMALTVLTGCGNSVSNKTITDALNDMAKADNSGITFTEKSELNAKAKALADAAKKKAESEVATQEAEGDVPAVKPGESTEIGGVKPATDTAFMWLAEVETSKMNTTAQAHKIYEQIIDEDNAINIANLTGKVPADARDIGFASVTIKGVNYRIAIVTAAAEDEKKPDDKKDETSSEEKKDDNTSEDKKDESETENKEAE